MSDSWQKRIIEVAVAVAAVVECIAIYYAQCKANPFKPMELACVDTEGKAATKDTTLRYYRDGGTIVGYDEQGMFCVYTPLVGGCADSRSLKK